MSKWFGEQRDYTPNELSFMVKAAQQCRKCQEAGKCKWGSKECCQCKWQAPMAAIKEQDQFTQSRIEDKADTLDFIDDMFESSLAQQKRRERVAAENVKIFAALAAALFLMAWAAISMHALPNEARHVMKQLADEGPKNWYYFDGIDCKDWSLTFMDLWYKSGMPDKSCVLVRNVDAPKKFDHLMVAVMEDGKWTVIEPQACEWDEAYWNPAVWWGSKYSPDNDMYGQSWLYLKNSDKDASRLLEKSGATYEEFERSLIWESKRK